jgi:membrane fusion protein, heavy metal efflux system
MKDVYQSSKRQRHSSRERLNSCVDQPQEGGFWGLFGTWYVIAPPYPGLKAWAIFECRSGTCPESRTSSSFGKIPNSKFQISNADIGRWISLARSHVLVASVLLFGTLGCHKASTSAEQSQIQVENEHVLVTPGTAPASSISIEESKSPNPTILALNGRMVWDDNVTTRLFTPFAGRVTKIPVETGQSVKEGEPLALIASPDYGQAQADARRAATDLVLSERTLARTKELLSHGAAAEKDLQAAEADMERARLEKQRTAERLALYGSSVESVDQSYVLKAPIPGIVVEKNINPGAELRSDQMLANTPQLASPLFVITDPRKLWIQIDVPERDQGRVRLGQTFTIRSTSLPGEGFAGKVEFISDSLDPTTRTVKVRGSVPNEQRRLKAEMFVKAEFVLEPEPGVEVSNRAVFLRGEKHYVMLEDKPGRYLRREVTVGSEHAGRLIITDGLKPGQRVVVDGALLLEQILNQSNSPT